MINDYKKYKFGSVSVYINSESPDWFVPNDNADSFLNLLESEKDINQATVAYAEQNALPLSQACSQVEHFAQRFESESFDEYKGRASYRNLKTLKECWIHITNRCNMTCKHCMFSSDNGDQPSLDYDKVISIIKEAYGLGCRVFYFTGGEPFVYARFTDVCDEIFKYNDAHVVVLTNAKIIRSFANWLQFVPSDRLHFQISVDGLASNHDAIRGKGEFETLIESINFIAEVGIAINLSMSVNSNNVVEMPAIIDLAADLGVANVHFLWLFKKGNAQDLLYVEPEIIFENLHKAYIKSKEKSVTIDNVEIMKSQLFTLPGTRFDLSNSAWESLAIGPAGYVYPSPALIGEHDLRAGHIDQGLANLWSESEVLNKVRNLSFLDDEKLAKDPFRYFHGGGDIDHSFINANKLVGADPYIELYKQIMLMILAEENNYTCNSNAIAIISRMGEKINECDEDSYAVAFTHSNCVLSLPGKDGHYSVRSFYSQAAEEVNEDIINPVAYSSKDSSHIPQESKVRAYGCGSPVTDCYLGQGETLVDLGSGTGSECFIAARTVGEAGTVYGVDMADPMLEIARRSSKLVADKLGYANVEFRKAFLEDLPFENDTVDVVISNCVINLSPNKRKVMSEVFRVLKTGGRLCISDIVSDEDIPLNIKYNEKLRGECIGGAMKSIDLFAMLDDIGFVGLNIKKRFLYREIKGHKFYSVTYLAYKPKKKVNKTVVYRGPLKTVILPDGQKLRAGHKTKISIEESVEFDDSFLILDVSGNPTNVSQDSCCCAVKPNNYNGVIA